MKGSLNKWSGFVIGFLISLVSLIVVPSYSFLIFLFGCIMGGSIYASFVVIYNDYLKEKNSKEKDETMPYSVVYF